MISDGNVKYIYSTSGENNNVVNDLIKNYNIENIIINSMYSIDGGITNTNENYFTIMNNNSRTWDPQVKEITNKYRQQYLDASTDEERQVIADKMQEELTSLGYQKQDSLLNALAQLRGLNYSYTPIWKAKVTIPTTATPTYAAKGGTLDVTKLATTAVKEKNKDIERMYKDWSKKDDRFFNQLGKLRQARFDKIIRIK